MLHWFVSITWSEFNFYDFLVMSNKPRELPPWNQNLEKMHVEVVSISECITKNSDSLMSSKPDSLWWDQDGTSIGWFTILSPEPPLLLSLSLFKTIAASGNEIGWFSNRTIDEAGKRVEKTKHDFRCPSCPTSSWSGRFSLTLAGKSALGTRLQFAALPLVKPVESFARAVVNWRSRSVAKLA